MRVATNEDLDEVLGPPPGSEELTNGEFEESGDDSDTTIDTLHSASDMLKKNALLFEYLADPDFCKTITKREREIMSRQAVKIYNLTAEIDVAISTSEEL